MRRKDREVTNMEEILGIIKKCDVIRLAFFDEEYPYIIPLNFGYSYDGTELEFYFHGAKEGKKISLIHSNPKAAFELDCSHKLIPGPNPCDYTMEYESVCGIGEIRLVPTEEKAKALTHLMRQYSQEKTFEFSEAELNAITVFILTVNHITGKRLKKKGVSSNE